MRFALRSREILCKICGELAESDLGTPPESAALNNLLNLGLANKKLFLSPALNEIWRDQNSLTPLLLCFPEDAVEKPARVKKKSNDLNSVIFSRALYPADWDRFLFYAPWVKTLNFTQASEETFPPVDTWNMLLAARPMGVNHLLPNLEHLVTPAYNSTFHFIRLLCSPSLKVLNIQFHDKTLSPSALAALSTLYPTLRKLIIRLASPDDVPDIGDVIQQPSPSLRCLNLTYADQSIFQHAARIRTLTGFALHHLDDVEFTIEPGQFPALRHLTLGNTRLTRVTRFLQGIPHSSLEALILHNIGSSGLTTWERLLYALKPFKEKLLCLSIQEDYRASRTLYTITVEALRPLFTFENLTILALNSAGRLEIDNADLREIAKAWPQFLQLQIQGKQGETPPKISPTLTGLVSLVRSCCWLNRLEIYIDAAVITPEMVHQRPGCGSTNRHITKLGVFNSPLADSVTVAAYLSALFPNLTSIVATNSSQYAETWGEVERHLQMAKTILQWRN